MVRKSTPGRNPGIRPGRGGSSAVGEAGMGRTPLRASTSSSRHLRVVDNATFMPQRGAGQVPTSRYLILNSISTYLRMLGTLAVGVMLTRYQVTMMSPEGYGVFVLLMSNVGLINIIQVTTRSSLIRELSDAFHANDAEEMGRRFTAAVGASAVLALAVTAIALAITPLVVRVLVVPVGMEEQVLWSWMALGVTAGLVVLTAPHTTILGAIGRISLANLQMFSERALSLVGALLVFVLPWGRANPLLAYILAESFIVVLTRAAFGVYAHVLCPTACFRKRHINRSAVMGMFRTGRHVVMLEISTNLYDRTNQVLINLFLGPLYNTIFGLSALLLGYTKQIATGLCYGIEPLAAKFARQEGGKEGIADANVPQAGLIGPDDSEASAESALDAEPTGAEAIAARRAPNAEVNKTMAPLILTVTRVQAGVVLPVVALLGAAGHPIVELWLADRVELKYPGANALIANLLILLIIGNPFFVIMQGTLRILLGAGQVAAYSRQLLWAGILQGVIAVGTLLLTPIIGRRLGLAEVETQRMSIYAVVAGMSVAYLIAYGAYLPRLTCRLYGITHREMYIGAMMPGLSISMIPVIVTLGTRQLTGGWTGLTLAADVVLSGVLSAGAFWGIVLRSNERARLLELVRRGGSRAGSNP